MMTRFSLLRSAALLVIAAALTAGCEKRPAGYDPDPNTPEGVVSTDARLITYRNQALRVMIRDYGSPTADSVVVGVSAFPGATTMPLLLLFDATVSNEFEMYRRDDGGKFTRTTDFDIDSHFKYVNAGIESYFTSDPAPGNFQPPSYLARGLLNGVATHASPLSNESRMLQTDLPPVIYDGTLSPTDSLFLLSWIGVPGAVGYWIHAYEKPVPSGQRLRCALPGPLSYLTAGDMLIGFYLGNNPGGSVQYRLGSPGLLTLTSNPPLLGRDYFIRISAIDATGQVIAQTPGDLDSLAMSDDLVFLAPPAFSPEDSKLFFALGGPKVTRRAPVHGPALGTGADAVAPPPGEGLVPMAVPKRHVANVMFPFVAPYHESRSLAGHH